MNRQKTSWQLSSNLVRVHNLWTAPQSNYFRAFVDIILHFTLIIGCFSYIFFRLTCCLQLWHGILPINFRSSDYCRIDFIKSVLYTFLILMWRNIAYKAKKTRVYFDMAKKRTSQKNIYISINAIQSATKQGALICLPRWSNGSTLGSYAGGLEFKFWWLHSLFFSQWAYDILLTAWRNSKHFRFFNKYRRKNPGVSIHFFFTMGIWNFAQRLKKLKAFSIFLQI